MPIQCKTVYIYAYICNRSFLCPDSSSVHLPLLAYVPPLPQPFFNFVSPPSKFSPTALRLSRPHHHRLRLRLRHHTTGVCVSLHGFFRLLSFHASLSTAELRRFHASFNRYHLLLPFSFVGIVVGLSWSLVCWNLVCWNLLEFGVLGWLLSKSNNGFRLFAAQFRMWSVESGH